YTETAQTASDTASTSHGRRHTPATRVVSRRATSGASAGRSCSRFITMRLPPCARAFLRRAAIVGNGVGSCNGERKTPPTAAGGLWYGGAGTEKRPNGYDVPPKLGGCQS